MEELLSPTSRHELASRFVSPDEVIEPVLHEELLQIKRPATIEWNDVRAHLTEEQIDCYKHNMDPVLRNLICSVPLANPSLPRELPQRTSVYKPRRQWVFCISTTDGKYFFSCESEVALQGWLDKLEVNMTRIHANMQLYRGLAEPHDTTPLTGVFGSAKVLCVPTLQLVVGLSHPWRVIEGWISLISMPMPRIVFRLNRSGGWFRTETR